MHGTDLSIISCNLDFHDLLTCVTFFRCCAKDETDIRWSERSPIHTSLIILMFLQRLVGLLVPLEKIVLVFMALQVINHLHSIETFSHAKLSFPRYSEVSQVFQQYSQYLNWYVIHTSETIKQS